MTEAEVHAEVSAIFQSVLRSQDLVLSRFSTAQDVSGWTSLTHIRLMVAIEDKFKIRFSAPEVIGFKNYGELLDQIKLKLGSH